MRTCVSLIKAVTLNKDFNAALESITGTIIQSSEMSEVWLICVIKIIKSRCLGHFFLMGTRVYCFNLVPGWHLVSQHKKEREANLYIYILVTNFQLVAGEDK